jgi:hypothetical protein
VPGADAAEEEVALYLAHVGVCPFHAAVEQREEARVRSAASLASSDLGALLAEARGGAAESGDRLDARSESRLRPSDSTLSIRVDGVERACFNLMWRRRVTLEAEAGALVAVWRPGRNDAGEETYLTSYLLPVGAKQVSETVRASGHTITFTARAKADGKMRLTVACAARGWLRARRRSATQSAGRPPDEPARARRLAVALCALAAVVLLALLLFLPKERPAPVARQEQPARTAEAPPPPPPPQATPFNTHSQNRQDVAPGHTPAPPAPPRVPQGGRRGAPPPRTPERLTVADVRRIYVGAGTYDPQLREALIERLRASDRFIVVTGEQQADAVLLCEQPRGAGVSMHLVTRGGKSLWFTTQPTGAGGVEDVGDLAARIVAALTAAADRRQSPLNTPRR